MATYPSLYRAKAVNIRAGVVEAYVPQVFGETTVIVSDFLGDIPSASGMGWIFFQAGDPEFPVWSSGVSVINDSGGGGGGDTGTGPPVVVTGSDEVFIGPEPPSSTFELWYDTDAVAAGGGGGGGGGDAADEVWIGTTTPSDPGTELWYDTDELNTSDPDTARWNSAWGILWKLAPLGTATGGTPLAALATLTLGSPGAMLFATGRRYRFRGTVRAVTPQTAGQLSSFSLSVTGMPSGAIDSYAITTSGYTSLMLDAVFDGDGLIHTPVFTVVNNAAVTPVPITLFLNALSSNVYVEDVGPVAFSAPPPNQPASVWAPLPLSAGWSAFSLTDWRSASYRLIGDEVQLEGLIMNPSVPSAQPVIIATLPVGFRPPKDDMFLCWVNWNGAAVGKTGIWRIDIDTAGVMRYQWPYSMVTPVDPAPPTSVNHINLNEIRFSVTQ